MNGTTAGGADHDRPDDVEQYLDEMFDRLSGTGRAGRYALAETEDHLLAASAEEMAAGRSRVEAERIAVARFGPPVDIAGQLRRTISPWRIPRLASGLWAMFGLAALVLALAYFAEAGAKLIGARFNPPPTPVCGPGVPRYTYEDVGNGVTSVSEACDDMYGAMWLHLVAGLIALAVCVALLLGRRLAVRRVGLPPLSPRFPLTVAAVFALSGIALYLSMVWSINSGLSGRGLFALSQGPPFAVQGFASVTAVLVALATLLWYAVLGRRRSRPTAPPVYEVTGYA
jgi:hypothetical protein